MDYSMFESIWGVVVAIAPSAASVIAAICVAVRAVQSVTRSCSDLRDEIKKNKMELGRIEKELAELTEKQTGIYQKVAHDE